MYNLYRIRLADLVAMLQAMLSSLFIESVGSIGMIGLGSVSLSGRYFWMIVCGKEKT